MDKFNNKNKFNNRKIINNSIIYIIGQVIKYAYLYHNNFKKQNPWNKKNIPKYLQLNPALTDPPPTEFHLYQMQIHGPFK